jgi:hypothetical protein
VRVPERPRAYPVTAVLFARSTIVQRSSDNNNNNNNNNNADEAAHNWDKVICGYTKGTADTVDEAFISAGYNDGTARRKEILKALRNSKWAHKKIAHALGGQGSGIRGGTLETIKECAAYLIKWAATHPACVSGASANYSSGKKGKKGKKGPGLSSEVLGDLYNEAAIRIREDRNGMTRQQCRKEYVKKVLLKHYDSSAAEELAEEMYPTPPVVTTTTTTTTTTSSTPVVSSTPLVSATAPTISVSLPLPVVDDGNIEISEAVGRHLLGSLYDEL